MRRNLEEPHLGSFKLSRSLVLAWLLYAMLALAAAAALLSSTRAELVPPAVRVGAPIAFGVFLILFAVYRFALVRAGRYPAGKAFFQVGAGALFLTLLFPGASRNLSPAAERPLLQLMDDADPSVRAIACEVARYRPEAKSYAEPLVDRLVDDSPVVRAQALRSLQTIAGRDVGGGEGKQAIERWRAWVKAGESADIPGASH